ncbi:MAG TPA: PadR family transcriptional regulator [Solirubrobacterales bacterium]|nr:PadR family transcriptional regulator [Solirubrobacterales bacterium]
MLRHVLLGLLLDRPDHAYALKRRLAPGVPPDRLINDGVLYPLLAKLESEGLLVGAESHGRRGRPRRVYSVTRAGRDEFLRWLRSDEGEEGPPLHELFVAHPLVKLLFAEHLGPAAMRDKLEHQADRVAERIDALESLRALSQPGSATALGPSLLDLELSQLRDRFAWLRRESARLAPSDR